MAGILSNIKSQVDQVVSNASANVFVPRTVAPKSDEIWWQTKYSPCLARYNGTVLPNCFAKETEFISNKGVLTLEEACGMILDVPTDDGDWHEARVECFGKQMLYKIELEYSTYFATAEHRWVVLDKRRNGRPRRRIVKTYQLQPRHKIPYRMCNTEEYTRVISVTPTERYENVYCVVEPVTHTFTLVGGEITGNCVGYAYGRFAEILGEWPKNLPYCDAGLWLDRVKVSGAYSWGSQPKLGAVAVWKKPGKAGHVAIVEYIHNDGSIMLSESGYSASWRTRFWTSGPRTAPNWYGKPYVFQGFIYNPAAERIIKVAPWSGGIWYGTAIPENSPYYSKAFTGQTTDYMGGDYEGTLATYQTAVDHPARKFVRTAMSHIGTGGYKWVQENTNVGNMAWSAAMCCAVAKECEYSNVLMPGDKYSVITFGKSVVEDYGGQYIECPANGGSGVPQTGDIFAIRSGDAKSQYTASHIGIVRDVEANVVLTVEGDLNGGYYLYRRKVDDIAWCVRPDWTKVGGTLEVSSIVASPLYTSASTRADATMREVAYLSNGGEPSIDKTSVRLSVINYTSILSGIYDAAGFSNQVTVSSGFASEGGYSVNSDGLQPVNARLIFEFLTNKGLSAAQAVGFLANIERESNFSTSAVNRSSGASGICQWLGGRKSKMIAACGGSWSNNLTGQLEYLWSELNGDESRTLTRLKSEVTENDQASAEQAAEIVVRQFERPGNYGTEVPIRQANARKYWGMLLVTSTDGGGSVSVSAMSKNIVTKFGVTLSAGSAIAVPSWVKQSGIEANFTDYARFYSRWSRGTNQRKLADIWGQQGKPSSHYVATINGYFLVATTTTFGQVGDIISVVLEDGTFFNAIIGDSKGADVYYSKHAGETGNKYGHAVGGGKIDVIEWESAGSSQSSLRSGLKQAGFYGKKVVKIVNYGSWING